MGEGLAAGWKHCNARDCAAGELAVVIYNKMVTAKGLT